VRRVQAREQRLSAPVAEERQWIRNDSKEQSPSDNASRDIPLKDAAQTDNGKRTKAPKEGKYPNLSGTGRTNPKGADASARNDSQDG